MDKCETSFCIWCDKEINKTMEFCSTNCKNKYDVFSKKLSHTLRDKSKD